MNFAFADCLNNIFSTIYHNLHMKYNKTEKGNLPKVQTENLTPALQLVLIFTFYLLSF